MEAVRKSREIVRFTLIAVALAGVLTVAGLALAPEAVGIIINNKITAIDAKTGRVTVKEEGTGRTFEFEVKDRAALGKLKVGQKVDADLPDMKTGAKGSLKLAGGEAVGIIIPDTDRAARLHINSIDAKTGLVTGKEEATGRTVRFQVKDQAFLAKLKVGQKVYADFKGMKASLKPTGAEAVGIAVIGN